MVDDACADVVRLERWLLEPAVRARPDLVRPVLHPEFVELGSSGRVWDADEVLVALAAEPGAAPAVATDVDAVLLSAGVALVTFRTENAGVRCFRSSIWLQDDRGGWLLRFHQASVLPAG